MSGVLMLAEGRKAFATRMLLADTAERSLAVVPQVSADFDRYGASASAYPVAALKQSTFIKQLVAGELAQEWTTVRLVSDDPAKGLGQAPCDTLVSQRLREVLGRPIQELLLVSPYFVPTDSGTRASRRRSQSNCPSAAMCCAWAAKVRLNGSIHRPRRISEAAAP